jgi:hypothetical protein
VEGLLCTGIGHKNKEVYEQVRQWKRVGELGILMLTKIGDCESDK